jgi:hypothetical protein
MTETTLVYNRPALVEQRFTDVAQVRFLDNKVLDYVPLSEVDQ